jgi:hypothetical protein
LIKSEIEEGILDVPSLKIFQVFRYCWKMKHVALASPTGYESSRLVHGLHHVNLEMTK